MPQKNKGIIILVIVIALLIVGIVMTNNKGGATKLSPEEAQARAQTFINDILMQGQGVAEIQEVTKLDSPVYTLKVKLEGSDEPFDSYITADGKLFFPQSLDIAEMMGENEAEPEASDEADNNQPVAAAPKADKPVVELFVMSHCPYGTQIEKGMVPVVKALGSSIDFQLKFVDYAMHGEKELTEQMKQVCINNEQHDKLLPYLECFLQDGDTTRCLGATGIDQGKLNTCVTALDSQYRIMEVFNNKEGWSNYPPFPVYAADNEKYSVGGSPTLIVNGEVISSNRDSASLAALICNSFAGEQPAACANQFDSASPAPGFGTTTTNSATDATCN